MARKKNTIIFRQREGKNQYIRNIKSSYPDSRYTDELDNAELFPLDVARSIANKLGFQTESMFR